MSNLTYPFTEAEMKIANDEWGANCGPAALAFALQVPLDRVRPLLEGFDEKRYTNPTMMKGALSRYGKAFNVIPDGMGGAFHVHPSLVRIQWAGPWTKPGVPPRVAYRHTHWICTYKDEYDNSLVFDCNGGINPFDKWRDGIVPLILSECVPKSDGGWFPTHVWRLFVPSEN